MEKIIGIKHSANMNNSRLGYAEAILVNKDGSWEIATKENVPKRGEIFIYGNYEQDVDAKYENGVLFETKIELTENADTSSCEYSSQSSEVSFVKREEELALIFEVGGSIRPDRILEINSPLKPSNITYFSAVNGRGSRDIVGPFELASSRFDASISSWHATFRQLQATSLASFGLEPHTVFQADVATIPSGQLIELQGINSIEGKIYACFGLSEELNTINAEQALFIENRALVSLIEEVLNPNSKLGRRGRREFLSQLEATKTLKPLIKEKATELVQSAVEARDDLVRLLVQNGETSPEQQDLIGQGSFEEIKRLKEEIENLNASSKDAAQNYELLERELNSVDKNAVLKLENEKLELEEQLAETVNKISLEKNYERLQWEIENADTQLANLQEEVQKLDEIKSSLHRQINQDDRAFRDKALEVIPFLNILSTSVDSNSKPIYEEVYEAEEYLDCHETFIDELANRVKKQGYVADKNNNFLYCAIAATFVSRFVGIYGEPGSGKTTWAKCLAHALGLPDVASTFVNVGKGWNSHSDFIGYANTFIDKFKYQDDFFTQFSNTSPVPKNHPVRTVILDEASLSPVDSYLSDFMSIGNGFQSGKSDMLKLSGQTFCFQPDFRFLLTFNFDENTETLPKKFLDRMPLIHCEATDYEGRIELNHEEKFKPFSGQSISTFLSLTYSSDSKELANKIKEFESFLEPWDSIGILGQRKRMQIDQFIRLISIYPNLDNEYIRDFISFTFLLPSINGTGEKLAQGLSSLHRQIESLAAREAVEKILTDGERFLQYRYL